MNRFPILRVIAALLCDVCDDIPIICDNLPKVFNVQYNINIDTEGSIDMDWHSLFGNNNLKLDLEQKFKDYLNSLAEEGMKFHTFTITEEKGQKNVGTVRRGKGKGLCYRACRKPPTFGVYRKNGATGGTTDLMSQLQNTSFQLPMFTYTLTQKISKLEDGNEYDAIFAQTTYNPWSTLKELGAGVKFFSDETTQVCNQKKCKEQNKAMIDIYNTLKVNYDSSSHECSWPGALCDGDDIVTQLWIGEMFILSYSFY